jgi:hypothetical protein
MKKLFALLLIAGTLHASAQDSTVPAPGVSGSTEVKTEAVAVTPKEDPKWKFFLGESRFSSSTYNYYTSDSVSGSGLRVGFERDLGKLFSLGADYAQFKTDFVSQTSNAYTGYVALSPIHYSFGTVDFAGSIQAGLIESDNLITSTSNEFFYGGAIDVSLSKQVGLRFDTKVCLDVKYMTALSLIGYY